MAEFVLMIRIPTRGSDWETAASYPVQMVLLQAKDGELASGEGAHILQHFGTFVRSFCSAALSTGYSIAFRRTRWITDATVLDRYMEDEFRPPWGYPIELWLVPGGAPRVKESVAAWFAEPMDHERFTQAIDEGGVWVSIADVFLDISAPPGAREVLRAWIDHAVCDTDYPVEWGVFH